MWSPPVQESAQRGSRWLLWLFLGVTVGLPVLGTLIGTLASIIAVVVAVAASTMTP